MHEISFRCSPCNIDTFAVVVPVTITAELEKWKPVLLTSMEGVDPIEIVDKTQCVEDIMHDLVSEEKKNEGSRSNFIKKRPDNLDENNMKNLIFKTPIEFEVFYFTCAKAVGFGVRRETPQINHHGIVTSSWFCCDRKGVRSEKDKNREDKRRKAGHETRHEIEKVLLKIQMKKWALMKFRDKEIPGKLRLTTAMIFHA
ncbi:hypothetical protein Cgig2_027946 [Carnegiea gigantea]|uniref:FAR1 domain-containing protein n=1 Tax=Carnegiea gigantea TaxID=171969 RepID=A0A9Q1GXW7_9CARY|nr:hypothetical protein Cgig2_027946 [Carnegiea gigantea]